MIYRTAALLMGLLALAGCRDPIGSDLAIPMTHPAHPDARAAPPIAVTAALEPEFEHVRPDLEQPTTRPPEDDGTGHHHH